MTRVHMERDSLDTEMQPEDSIRRYMEKTAICQPSGQAWAHLAHSLRRSQPQPTLQSLASSLQNCEKIHLWFSSHSADGCYVIAVVQRA